MNALTTFIKHPTETQDYDISFVAWLTKMGDTQKTVEPVTVTVTAGITFLGFTTIAGVVKVWLSGGVAGTTYRMVITMTTATPRVKRVEVLFQVAV